jgi:hypothetical protein
MLPKFKLYKLLNQPKFVHNIIDNSADLFTVIKSNLESEHFINSCPNYKIRKYNYSAVTYDIEIYNYINILKN